jgi:hypothetical protein
MRLLTGLAAAGLVAGCITDSPTTRRVDYRCDDGQQLTVVFQPRMARIVSETPPLELPVLRAASGFAFGTPQNSIRGRGREMTLTRGRAAPIRCLEVARR